MAVVGGSETEATGGGIANYGVLSVTNSTFSGNQAPAGDGGAIQSAAPSTVTNSIFANSTGGNCSGSIVNGGYNISDDSTCGFGDRAACGAPGVRNAVLEMPRRKPGGRKFCSECGAPMAFGCPQCGASNEVGEKFCGECGATLTLIGAAPAQAPEPPAAKPTKPGIRVTVEQPDASRALDGERKTVTALFADIKGSTELEQDLDPEEARAIIDPALKLINGRQTEPAE